MFRRTAQVMSLGSAEQQAPNAPLFRLSKKAEAAPQSYYLDGARTIPVRDLLERVAGAYAISPDPKDYLWEAIRANTTNAPNENNDGFHRSELLRFDTRIAMPVYKTYIGKPHHVDHRTDDPKQAHGIILDAHYNDETPALATCPRCELKTASREHRDEHGLHCRRCGYLVKDEFVEILLGIDARKNPAFADGVRQGHLNAGSMGCNCLSTVCNVCAHVAYSRPEFCEHIKAGAKGSLWKKQGGLWVKTSVMEVDRDARKRGLRWDPTDFCYLTASGFEVRKAFEYCQNVIFDEYSRVGQPADPKARQREILRQATPPAPTARPKFFSMAPSTSTAAPSSRAGEKRVAQMSETKWTVIRINGDDNDVHAGESLDAALAAAGASAADDVEVCELAAPDAESAVAMFDPSKAKSLNEKEGDVVLQAPQNEPIVIQPPGAAPPGAPPEGGPPGAPPGGPPGQTIDQLQDQEMVPPGAPPPNEQMTPGEMGMVPPGASAGNRKGQGMRFKAAYAKWTVEVSPQGNARIFAPGRRTAERVPVLVIRGEATDDEKKRQAFGQSVLRSLATEGFVATAMKMRGLTTPKVAQVVEHGIDDMKEFADKYLHDSVREDNISDMQDGLAKPPKTTRDDETSDMADGREKPPKTTQDDGHVDHAEGKPEGVKSVTEESNTDMREQREKKNLGKDRVLDDEIHDHQEKLAALAREKIALLTRVGARIAHSAKPNIAWTVRVASLNTDGSFEVAVSAENQQSRKISQKDLLEFWRSLDTPRMAQEAKERLQATLPPRAAATASTQTPRAGVSAEVEAKLEARQKKAWAAREATLKQAHEEELEAAKLATVGAFCRALRIVAKRQAANLEASPLRQAAEHLLASPRTIGVDAATQQPIPYSGMDPELVRYLVAEIYETGHPGHLENLMNRAADLMVKGDQYLLDAEVDAQNFRASLPPITAAHVQPIDETALYAAHMRQAAVQGNFALNPQPPVEQASPAGDKRSAIRNAVSGTLTSTTLNQLRVN